ncbi:MAG TPA: alanine dehydrogenase [Syntrophobacteraceae bacterium]|nr:alanine dehydrogenase [Syntrophobacteraceae bacterium]
MIVGVTREIKSHEYRVAMVPTGVRAFVAHGHTVLVEQGAGTGAGIADDEYRLAGARILPGAVEVFAQAEMVMKVKEPLRAEYDYLRPGLILFTYLHLAPAPELTRVLLEKRVTGVAYETIQEKDGALPLLTPMSEIAGRMAIQVGAHYLEKPAGGRGVLLGGVPGVNRGKVTVIGGGVVGTNAAKIAMGMGANVVVIDNNPRRLAYLDDIFGNGITTLMSHRDHIEQSVTDSHLVVGAALVAGGKTPKLVTRDLVARMKPGTVIVDVSVDQGGCCETCTPTTYDNPTYLVDEVVHYCVANMPGSVPRTSTFALTNATLRYGLELADRGFETAVLHNPVLAHGVNTYAGEIAHPAVAKDLEYPYRPVEELLR